MSMKMLITDAGLAEVVNAEQSGTAPVVLSHIAFGTGQYTPTADMTALKSEFKRFDSIKGGAIAGNVIHISLHDTDKQAYTVYEVGVFTESGTLFAVYSQLTPIVQKAEDAEIMLVTDFALSDIDVDSITIGDTNFILNPATTETAGIVELATEAEAKAGTDTTKAMTPATTKAAIDDKASKYLPLAGGKMSGSIYQNNDTRRFIVGGGSTYDSGAHITLDGKSYTDGTHNNGSFTLVAHDGTNNGTLIGQPNGSLTWEEKNIVRSVNGNGADSAGNITAEQTGCLPVSGGAMTTTKAMTRDVNNSFLGLQGGTGENNDGAQLYLCGSNHSSMPGTFQLHARNSKTDKVLEGKLDGTLEWDGKSVLNNSFLMPSDSGAINLTAGTSSAGGAYFRLYGKDNSSGAGQFVLATTNGTDRKALTGKPDGTLTWNGVSVATINNTVNLTGYQVVDGQKHFTTAPVFKPSSKQKVLLKSETIDTTTDSVVSGENQLYFLDKNDYVYGVLQSNVTSDGGVTLSLTCRKNGASWTSLQIISAADGSTYVLAPTPSDTDNSNKIATTKWVRNKLFGIDYANPTAKVSNGGTWEANSTYTVPSQGYVIISSVGQDGQVKVNGTVVGQVDTSSGSGWTSPVGNVFLPVKANDKITTTGALGSCYFYFWAL